MKYFDSHAHYYDGRFKEESEKSVDDIIDALLKDNVSYIINVGTDVFSSRLAIEQARKFDRMYTAIGIHPSDTRGIDDMDLSLDGITQLIKDKESKCVCLGEIGLDYHYPDTDKDKQLAFFEAQLVLAKDLDIPVCIHDRESHADIMTVLRRHSGVRGVLHSFSGSVEMARELVDMGFMISFSGTLTFTNARKPREVAAAIPHENIMIETDCPYLTPHPHRGEINEPKYTSLVAQKIAEIKELSYDTVVEQCKQNALNLFKKVNNE